MFKRHKIRFISISEMNEVLEDLKDHYQIIINKPTGFKNLNFSKFKFICWANEGIATFKITLRDGKERTEFVCRLDEAEVFATKTGLSAFNILQHYYKSPKSPVNVTASATPLLWLNEDYNETRNYAYEYDLNSAYSSIMLRDTFPDTSKLLKPGVVKDDEIGFDLHLNIVHTGCYAIYRFKTMESPYKDFVKTYYNKKKNAKNAQEKADAKIVLNASVGYWQRKNPFLRAYIVNSCNEFMLNLMDENTIYCNTDAIVSLKPRPDIEKNLGQEIGQWKKIEGYFAYKGFNYQWNDEIPSFRGIPKNWFKKGWDILKDDLPYLNNAWFFDENMIKLIRNKGGNKK